MKPIYDIKDYPYDKDHTICFSGHRPKSLGFQNTKNAYRYESYITAKMDIIEKLSQLVIQHNITRFITGGAQGWDQLCFWAVENLRKFMPTFSIQNIVFIPFPEQESRWSNYGLFGQQEYKDMLNQADAVYAVHTHKPEEYYTIAKYLNDRNIAMVDASSRILFPEKQGFPLEQKKGGTANCYQYAKNRIQIEKFIYTIDNLDTMKMVL